MRTTSTHYRQRGRVEQHDDGSGLHPGAGIQPRLHWETFGSDTVETQCIETSVGRFAYRRFGRPADVPLVMCQRFRSTLDHWDPVLLDGMARDRELILFDNTGVNGPPATSQTRSQAWPMRRAGSSMEWDCPGSIYLSHSHAALAPAGVQAQSGAMTTWGRGEGNSWNRLNELTLPVLVAAGAHDVMLPAFGAYAMSQRLPDATVVIYSDAGHGLLFQHADRFSALVTHHLR